MRKYFHDNIVRIIDGALYGFIGPFTVLYIIPKFLMNISGIKSKAGFGMPVVETAGLIIIWCGAAIAIWCATLMLLFGKGTPLVTSAPQRIMSRSIYAYVRHPMMWSLMIIVLGQALMYGHLVLFVWLAAMSRILHLIVIHYEEPQLELRFGESWQEYCQDVPRWFPRFRKDKATAVIIEPHTECDPKRSSNIRNVST
ncbi:MAG TPA: isoprenylcysteine carboxylmethyltransferase family protein [Smithellaceae bacterium]|nr:isoprenylcysteine carboxylmethyltransferase family protein [Smithella sp.]HPL97495.1 isoprenylcysteine carboxylmethyltransferase family protein [Smithellaceae bacterium]